MKSPWARCLWSLPVVLVLLVGPAADARPPGFELGSQPRLGAETAAVVQPDCPGGQIYDDGVAENGYSGNPATVSDFEAVHQFTPTAYPMLYTKVCIAFVSLGGPDLAFAIEVRDDDGPSGTPGTLLGSVPASATGIPGGLPCAFYEFDISGLGVVVSDGSVFIGPRYDPMTYPSRFVCGDESGTTPLHPGFVNFNLGDGFQPTQSVFPNYRAFLVRAQGVQKVAKQVTLKKKPAKVKPGKKVTLTATVTPCPGHEGDVIEFQMKKGGWKTKASKASDATCTAKFRPKIKKKTKFRAHSPEQDADHFAGTSGPVTVKIKKS
ncbi:MAG: hypothetical protein ACRDHV_08265 [Actinomycetota bacterium]